MAEVLKVKDRTLNRKGKRRMISEMRPRIGEGMLQEAYRRTLPLIEKLGILCLCERNDDILMWSHYADKHRGACLMFDTSSDFFAEMFPVSYQTDYPSVNFLQLLHDMESKRGPNETAQRQFTELIYLTKAAHWTYEHEWRIIRESFGLHAFPSSSLIGVVLGCQTTADKVQRVPEWIAAGSCAPVIYRARVSQRRFALEIEEAAP